MRSSDAWLGWVYDVFNFSQISLYVLLQLKSQHKIKLELGELTLTAGSQHIYQQHWKPALKCIYGSPYLPDKLITNFKNGEDLISHLWNRAGKKESDTNQLVLVGIE
jgi:thymidylate synthase